MNRDTSSGSKNYRSRRYDDEEHERHTGRDGEYPRRSREGESRRESGNDRIPSTQQEITIEDSKKSRSTSSRSKSPNCRWDDPVKLFSEVK